MSINQQIVNYLQTRGWVPGGELERDISLLAECKASNVSRRCRELENEGKIVKDYRSIDGGRKFVVYQIAKEPVQETLLDVPQRTTSYYGY